MLERECVVAREGERTLQSERDALTLQLRQKEQTILQLRVKHDQLVNQVNQEKVCPLKMHYQKRYGSLMYPRHLKILPLVVW